MKTHITARRTLASLITILTVAGLIAKNLYAADGEQPVLGEVVVQDVATGKEYHCPYPLELPIRTVIQPDYAYATSAPNRAIVHESGYIKNKVDGQVVAYSERAPFSVWVGKRVEPQILDQVPGNEVPRPKTTAIHAVIDAGRGQVVENHFVIHEDLTILAAGGADTNQRKDRDPKIIRTMLVGLVLIESGAEPNQCNLEITLVRCRYQKTYPLPLLRSQPIGSVRKMPQMNR